MRMVAKRPIRVIGTNGMSVTVTPEGKKVPESLVRLAMAMGCDPESAEAKAEAQKDKGFEYAEIVEVFKGLLSENRPEYFNVHGVPRVAVMKERFSQQISGDDIKEAWQAFTGKQAFADKQA